MIALWSDSADCASITPIAGVPIAAAISSGGSSTAPSSRSTSGRGIIVRVGVADSALLVLAQPLTMIAIPAMAAARRMSPSPFEVLSA
ncbi:hypothetical protein MPRF_29100 [Mycolicibacterium parafortuitum]|uniref:Uncharacterized protein n=1 Tax=Mycolicibacterium parafortuitum TaxID=39692 RepID=A0A7I7U517_MYCPF|nr:hypothetical protein MPRF_29100 [Mycolicibacterium parafortuitum]